MILFFILSVFSCTTGQENAYFITMIIMPALTINYSLSEEKMFLLLNSFESASFYCCFNGSKQTFAVAVR